MLSDTTQCAFWDARLQKYVAYIRWRYAQVEAYSAKLEPVELQSR